MLEDFIPALILGIIIGALLFFIVAKLTRKKTEPPPSPVKFSAKEVEALLQRNGYQIVTSQPKRTIITRIEGQDHFGYAEADYLVKREKKKYIIMVKSGDEPADPNEPNYRRKLLEIEYVFSPEGILLVDPAAGTIIPIEFHFPIPRNIDSFFQITTIIFVIAVILGIIWLLIQSRLF